MSGRRSGNSGRFSPSTNGLSSRSSRLSDTGYGVGGETAPLGDGPLMRHTLMRHTLLARERKPRSRLKKCWFSVYAALDIFSLKNISAVCFLSIIVFLAKLKNHRPSLLFWPPSRPSPPRPLSFLKPPAPQGARFIFRPLHRRSWPRPALRPFELAIGFYRESAHAPDTLL